MNTVTITQTSLPPDVLLRSAIERILDLEWELQKLRTLVARPIRNIRIHQPHRVITASPADILFIRAENNYSRIYLKEGVQYYTSRTLKSWANELATENFLRCHRTFLVHRDAIVEINRKTNEIVLSNAMVVPTSRRFQKSCLSSMSKYGPITPSTPYKPNAVVHKLAASPVSPLG